jgi:hypothetical protein
MKGVEEGTIVQKLGWYMGNVWSGASTTCLQNPVSRVIAELGLGYVRVRRLSE